MFIGAMLPCPWYLWATVAHQDSRLPGLSFLMGNLKFLPGTDISFCAWLHQFLRLKCKMAAAADIGFVLGAIVVAVGPQLLV